MSKEQHNSEKALNKIMKELPKLTEQDIAKLRTYVSGDTFVHADVGEGIDFASWMHTLKEQAGFPQVIKVAWQWYQGMRIAQDMHNAAVSERNALQEQLSEAQVFLPLLPIMMEAKSPEESKQMLIDMGVDERDIRGGIMGQDATPVAYVVCIGRGDSLNKWTVARGQQTFPGSHDEAEREISARIDALCTRAPMPENHRRGMPELEGMSAALHKAHKQLAVFWHVKTLQSEWYARLREAFDKHIWAPFESDLLNLGYDYDAAYDLFQKHIVDSFENVTSTGRGDAAARPKRRNKKKSA